MSDIPISNRQIFRRYKAGYEVWDETWENPQESDWAPEKYLRMRMAYTPGGAFIGEPRWAHRLCAIRRITPELRTPESSVCSIGFCEQEQKWYGWSHRALFGFGIGSEIKRGDCAYHPTDKEDFRLDCLRFWDSDSHDKTFAVGDERGPENEDGVLVSWWYAKSIPNEKLRGKIGGVFMPYPDEFGRGEWTAKSLDDARQMACDFAEGVS